jgi:hypothetical protein
VLRYIKIGCAEALKQPFAVIALFLYQLIWSLALYKFVQSIVVPLMHRYPGADQPKSAMQLFLAEGQFRLLKTDLANSYLWWILGLLIVRMVMTPFLNAAVYYSLAHTRLHAGYRFFKGIKELAVPFLAYYVIQMILTLGPLAWLLPKAKDLLAQHSTFQAAGLAILPWFAVYLIYGCLLHLCFMYLQFAKTTGKGILYTLILFVRYSLWIMGLSALLMLLSGILASIAITAAYIWAGFIALLVYQCFPIIKMFIKMWAITTQFELWTVKTKV